ncbi:NAD(P)H-quinone oxidoreductase [Aestuariibacter sp. AA17]|uniref:NAD(P)H-quinone oxidoreductase n=1 Tax=Fluctibacter corallii TaxID=2984329 RepID=A0ABT3A5T9_9ALTE|nr:NAD(P)H-quinone oxidoreductase [Aestuariibacter sp. AA17]MCV2884003.1 NAD(P)H-quinone oxidoreductase [Aestuariibacter sp. AA17]
MRFISYEEGAAPSAMSIAEMAKPEIKDHQVLIQVKAFGVNRADTLQRQGKYPSPEGESDILGLEVAGVIEDIGNDVTQFSIGDPVFGLVPGGGYGEFVAVDASHVMRKPDSLGFTDAAGVAEVFLTAFQSLVWHLNVEQGDNILIHAGASGVGLAAIQIANVIGANIAVTASSADKLSICKENGAHILINYEQEDFVEVVREQLGGVDHVLDFVGGEYLNKNLKVLNQDGHIVYLAMLAGRHTSLDMALLLGKRATITGSTLRNQSDEYKTELIEDFSLMVLPLLKNGKVRPNIDAIYPATDIATTHQRLESNDTMGKLIVTW